MNDDYRLSKFTKEQLQSFDEIEKRALAAPSDIDSLVYILTEIYRFGNYVVERINDGGKKCIRLRAKYDISELSIPNMIEGIEEYWEELTIKERMYVDKLKRLYDFKIGVLKLRSFFPNLSSWSQKRIMAHDILTPIEQNDSTQQNKLRNFGKGELQKELEPIVKEYDLQVRESVPMTKVRKITNRLISNGWDAKVTSVAEALRKMGFVRSVRK